MLYELDPLGQNPKNKILKEMVEISGDQHPPWVIPQYAPYFKDSLKIFILLLSVIERSFNNPKSFSCCLMLGAFS